MFETDGRSRIALKNAALAAKSLPCFLSVSSSDSLKSGKTMKSVHIGGSEKVSKHEIIKPGDAKLQEKRLMKVLSNS